MRNMIETSFKYGCYFCCSLETKWTKARLKAEELVDSTGIESRLMEERRESDICAAALSSVGASFGATAA